MSSIFNTNIQRCRSSRYWNSYVTSNETNRRCNGVIYKKPKVGARFPDCQCMLQLDSKQVAFDISPCMGPSQVGPIRLALADIRGVKGNKCDKWKAYPTALYGLTPYCGDIWLGNTPMPRPPMGGPRPHILGSPSIPLPATGPDPRGVADLTSTRLPDSSCIVPT